MTGEARQRMAAIVQRLASLGTEFGQNVLKDEKDWVLYLGEDDLAGLPDFLVASARREAKACGREDGFAITLSRSSVQRSRR